LPTWDDSLAGLLEAYGSVIDRRVAPAVDSNLHAELAFADGSAI